MNESTFACNRHQISKVEQLSLGANTLLFLQALERLRWLATRLEVLCLAFSNLRACFEKAFDLADRAGKVLAGSGSGPPKRRDPGYFGGVMTKRLGNRAQTMKATGRIVAIAVLSIQWH